MKRKERRGEERERERAREEDMTVVENYSLSVAEMTVGEATDMESVTEGEGSMKE